MSVSLSEVLLEACSFVFMLSIAALFFTAKLSSYHGGWVAHSLKYLLFSPLRKSLNSYYIRGFSRIRPDGLLGMKKALLGSGL